VSPIRAADPFDMALPLDLLAVGYRSMDERRAIKSS
jgi:hypothetical protein